MKSQLTSTLSTCALLLIGCGTNPAPSQMTDQAPGQISKTAAFQRPSPLQNEYKCSIESGFQIGGECISARTFKEACKIAKGKIEWSKDDVLVCHTRRKINLGTSSAGSGFHDISTSYGNSYGESRSHYDAFLIPGDQISFQKLGYKEELLNTQEPASEEGIPNLSFFPLELDYSKSLEHQAVLQLGPDTSEKTIPSKIWIRDSIYFIKLATHSKLSPWGSNKSISYKIDCEAIVEHCADSSGLSHYCD